MNEFLRKVGNPKSDILIYTDALMARGDMERVDPAEAAEILGITHSKVSAREVGGYTIERYSGQWHRVLGPDGSEITRGKRKEEAESIVEQLTAADSTLTESGPDVPVGASAPSADPLAADDGKSTVEQHLRDKGLLIG